MIGVYDSGSGGLTALSHLLRLAPCADICYLGDLPHAPYGTKTRAELIPIIEENTLRFLALGAEHILVACVTASSLYSHLSPKTQSHLYPITFAISDACAMRTRTGRVGIVSTTRTMREGVIKGLLTHRGLTPTESSADALVLLAERGLTSPEHPEVRDAIKKACLVHQAADVDTLILGCTHFPLFRTAFAEQMGEGVALIDSGREGALAFLQSISKDVLAGRGQVHFI